jgi:Ca2+-binding EF-hand superfamily protein
MEMQAVADRFDRDGDGFIDYKEFVAALRPERGEVVVCLECVQ